MKLLCAMIVAAWGAFAAVGALAEVSSDDAQRVFARVGASVVTVHADDGQGGEEGQGSGVVIGAGLVATNCHVVRTAPVLRVVGATADLPGKWIRQDAQNDLCIVAVEGLGAPAVGLRSSASLAVGEPVFAVGNPLGFGLAVSAGLITTIDTKSRQPVVIASAPLSPGSSGGGLFDRDGRLIGITTAILGAGQNINLVLSSDGLVRLATEGDIARLVASPPVPERRWKQEAEALQNASAWPQLDALSTDWSRAKPTAAEPLAYLALAQHGAKRSQEAAATLRRALELDKHYAFVWRIYAMVQKDLGKTAEAEKALSQAEIMQPFTAEPNWMRAEWSLQEGRLDEARQQIKESLRRGPGQLSAWLALGKIEDARGESAAALRAFQTALRLGEANTEIQQRVAQLLAATGKVDEASKSMVQNNPGKTQGARTQVAIGLAELQRGRLGPAEAALRQAVDLAPGLAEAWNGLGQVLLRSNRNAEAEKAFDQTLRLVGDNAEILSNRAAAHLAQKRLDAALADVRRAVTIDPKSALAWRLFGTVQIEAKSHHEAVAAFARVDELGKASTDDLVSLGTSQAEIGDVEPGLKTLARAEARDANHVRMCLSTAKALGRKGDIAKALVYLERALKIEPANAVAWSSKGFGLIKLGRLPEAVDALQTAVALAPELANSWINLGEAQLRSRNLGKAILALEKAIELAPQALDARLYLGQAYLGTRQTVKTREQVERLLDKQPGFAPGLALLAMSYLLEGNVSAAQAPYLKLKTAAPAVAQRLRDQAIAGGLTVAMQLPE